jgi:hypothetical protein
MQRLSFLMLQSFFPSVCLSWIFSVAATIMFVFTSIEFDYDIVWWGPLWGVSLACGLGFFIWLRRFDLVEHERHDLGLRGMALMIITIPVYVEAGIRRLTCRKLAYAVTAKGDLTSPDHLLTFKTHLQWGAVAAAALISTFFGDKTKASDFVALRIWLCWILAICLFPITVHYVGKLSLALTSSKAKQCEQSETSDTESEESFTDDSSIVWHVEEVEV